MKLASQKYREKLNNANLSSYDKYVNFLNKKSMLFKKIKKPFFVFLIIIIILIIGFSIFGQIIISNNLYPKNNNEKIALTNNLYIASNFLKLQANNIKVGGIFSWIFYWFYNFIWELPFLLAFLTHWIFMGFIWIGGIGLIEHLVDNPGLKLGFSLIFVLTLSLLFITLIIRAIKMTHTRDGDEGRALAKQTPEVLFFSITYIVCLPIVFYFVNGIIQSIFLIIVNPSGGNFDKDNLLISLINGSWDNGLPADSPTDWSSFSSHNGAYYLSGDTLNSQGEGTKVGYFLIILVFAFSAYLAFKFTFYAINLIFNIMFLYVIMFPALAKWPQDEGGSAIGIRDELISNYINLFSLYFFFSIFGIVFGIISQMQYPPALSPGITILKAILVLGAGKSITTISKKTSEFFLYKNKISYKTFGEMTDEQMKQSKRMEYVKDKFSGGEKNQGIAKPKDPKQKFSPGGGGNKKPPTGGGKAKANITKIKK